MVQRKCVPLYLEPEEYARLDRVASAEEREPVQQARWVLKQWLAQADEKRKLDPITEPLVAV